jgi:Trypsin-like peptidase domain/MAP3K TRAFs-binding domain
MDPKQYLAELIKATDEYRIRDVQALTDKIDPLAFDLPQIKKALGLIRRKCFFAELEHAASLFIVAGRDEPVIRRQWSQSLLDQGRVLQALAALNSLSAKFAEDPGEGPEIRGLIGRAYKQCFVNEGGTENLKAAISAYSPDWKQRRGDYRWHGINLVALLSRAKRDGISMSSALDPAHIAQQILDDIDQHQATEIWDYATAMEAAVAQGDDVAALAAAKNYVQHPAADAFELSSTLRQLKEVWRLEGTPLGNKLLPVLEFAVLQRKGGSVQPMQLPRVQNADGFQAVWGAEGLVYLRWLDTLYNCCNAIARVIDARTGGAKGTGFLLPGTSLWPAWGDDPVLLTNSHVISLNPADQALVSPSNASAEFTRIDGRPNVKLGELLYYSPKFEMDVSILRVALTPPGSTKLELSSDLPQITDAPGEQRVYVIGHPGGSELAVSLYDNKLAEYEKPYVRYRSPTQKGSSGSPVLDFRLLCFAIHHRERKELQLNEGITLGAIRDAMAAKPSTGR